MFTALSTLIPVFGIILLGILVQRMGFLPTGTAVCLNQFVYWIGLPPLLFTQLAQMKAGEIAPGIVWGFLLTSLFSYVISHAFFSGGFRRHKQESTILALLSSFPNCAFMGLPIIMLLLPGDSNAAVVGSLGAVLYFSVLLFADTKLEIARRKTEGSGSILGYLIKSLLHNPLLIASALGALISLFSITVPAPVLSMTSMLGATASPCALFCMGMILSAQMTSSRGFVKGWFRRQLPIHLLKLVVQPAICLGILTLFGVKGIPLACGLIVSAMPTGIAAYIIAEKYQVATEDSSLGIVANTALSVIFIPLYIILLQHTGLM